MLSTSGLAAQPAPPPARLLCNPSEGRMLLWQAVHEKEEKRALCLSLWASTIPPAIFSTLGGGIPQVTQHQNHLSQKRPLGSLSPTTEAAPPRPCNHVPSLSSPREGGPAASLGSLCWCQMPLLGNTSPPVPSLKEQRCSRLQVWRSTCGLQHVPAAGAAIPQQQPCP